MPDPSRALCSADQADLAILTYSKINAPDVLGQPRLASVLGRWFEEFLYHMFLKLEGSPLVRHAFLLAPKKSGVATGLAALLITKLVLNQRPHAEFAVFAPIEPVAKIVFRLAVAMIDADEELSKRFVVRSYVGEIADRFNGSRIKVRAFDDYAITGANLTGAVLYETQFLRNTEHAARTMRELRGSLLGESESFLIVAGSQTTRPLPLVFKAELGLARDVRDGKSEGGVLPLIYEPPADMDWRDPKNWPLLHPGIGRTISMETMQKGMEAAERGGLLDEWAAQYLNVEIAESDEKAEAA